MSDTASIFLIGVSIPRSGHHYLSKLLQAAYGDDLQYCEFYTPAGCCRALPCRRVRARISFQKNHDFDLTVPTQLDGVSYLVQFREPTLATLSDREYFGRLETQTLAEDRQQLFVWLAQKAAYQRRFLEKWVTHAPAAALLIAYRDLLHTPERVLQSVALRTALPLTDDAVAEAIRLVQRHVADFPPPALTASFVPRTLERSRFFDADLFAAFEWAVLRDDPSLDHLRCLPRTVLDEHPLVRFTDAELAFARGQTAEALTLLEHALATGAPNAFSMLRLAEVAAESAQDPVALDAVEAALRLRPGLVPALRLRSDLYARRATTELDRAVAAAEQLVEALPAEAGHIIHLANLRLRQWRREEARLLVLRALDLAPGEAPLWREASEVLARCDDLEAALGAVDQALARAPDIAECHHHRANLLARLGRIDDLAQAHQRAIDLNPGLPSWRWKYVHDLAAAGRVQQAREVWQRAIDDFPGDPLLQGMFGTSLGGGTDR